MARLAEEVIVLELKVRRLWFEEDHNYTAHLLGVVTRAIGDTVESLVAQGQRRG